MTADAKGVEIAKALQESGHLGCGCCAVSLEAVCPCGRTEEDLDYDKCPTCGQFAEYPERLDVIAEVVTDALRRLEAADA